MQKRNSDVLAKFLKEKGIKHAFGIIGSANSYIFDSINKLGYTQIVYVHHEQSAVMAMGAYFRASGKPSVALVTAGAGSSNALTGVISNWADSVPGLIISGQEQEKFLQNHKDLRMYGVQGYDSPDSVKKVTKYSKTLSTSDDIYLELENAFSISLENRCGPVWLDLPFDVQAKEYEGNCKQNKTKNKQELISDSFCKHIYKKLKSSSRPVLVGGHGVRISGASNLFADLVNKLKIPTLLTWSAIDLLPDDNDYNYGRFGIQGQRSSNFIIQNSDLVIVLGSRLSLLQTGYDVEDFAPKAELIINDIDINEGSKNKTKRDTLIVANSKSLIKSLLKEKKYKNNKHEWVEYCKKIKSKYPRIIPEHKSDKYINSYEFIDRLSDKLNNTDIIVTDMGTALLSGHYAIKIKDGQKMFTSLGLGEMGYGLPGAIGASFTDLNKNVICLNCDGGIMMNLQELQTIKHHNLPIKIVIFNNDGYLMIKHTQKMLFNGDYNGVNADTGLSLPYFKKLANAFDFPYYRIKSWENFNKNIESFLNHKGPSVCEVYMDPEQDFIPKVKGVKIKNNAFFAPPIEEMSPLLPYDEIEENMIAGINEKSKQIAR